MSSEPRFLLRSLLLAAAVSALTACGQVDPGQTDGGTDSGNPVDAGNDAGETTDGGMDDGGTASTNTTDIAVVRLNPDGSRDMSFGGDGVVIVDLGDNAGSVGDNVYGAAGDSQNRIVLFGNKKGEGARIDGDRFVARLTPNGELDMGFAAKGVHTLNIGGLNDTARHGIIQADGKIVASGYLSQPTGVGTQMANSIILLRLDDTGTPDMTFGAGGVISSNPFMSMSPTTPWGMAEAYAVGLQNGKYITCGYGRAAATGPVDLVSFRYDVTGEVDSTWGTSGAFLLDVMGDNDRGRNMVVLPDNRVLMVGSAVRTTGNVDAMTLMLTENGALDTTWSMTGHDIRDFGRTDEAFFGVATTTSGDFVAASGYRAGGNEDDDGLLLIRPSNGSAAGFVDVKAISENSNDRFFSAAFDSAGKVYAAGYVHEGEDSRMVIARFNQDGSADTQFGDNGVVIINVVEAGLEETARAVYVQADGKVVVAGNVAHK